MHGSHSLGPLTTLKSRVSYCSQQSSDSLHQRRQDIGAHRARAVAVSLLPLRSASTKHVLLPCDPGSTSAVAGAMESIGVPLIRARGSLHRTGSGRGYSTADVRLVETAWCVAVCRLATSRRHRWRLWNGRWTRGSRYALRRSYPITTRASAEEELRFSCAHKGDEVRSRAETADSRVAVRR